ncbi:hypothetical protein B0H19DRAFT_1194578, partial [Mycena capillaripes]
MVVHPRTYQCFPHLLPHALRACPSLGFPLSMKIVFFPSRPLFPLSHFRFTVLTPFTTFIAITPLTPPLSPVLLLLPCTRYIFFSPFSRIHVFPSLFCSSLMAPTLHILPRTCAPLAHSTPFSLPFRLPTPSLIYLLYLQVVDAVIKERPASKKSVVYAIRSSLLEISAYPNFSIAFFPRPRRHFSPLLVPLCPTCSFACLAR